MTHISSYFKTKSVLLGEFLFSKQSVCRDLGKVNQSPEMLGTGGQGRGGGRYCSWSFCQMQVKISGVGDQKDE